MKRKTILCALLAAACMASCAHAEDDFWTRNADFYYHANSACLGRQDMVPISEEAAMAFSKYTCPVCCAYPQNENTVDAAARGGTVVVRFNDAWLESQELTSVFGWNSDSIYSGKQAQRTLGEYLHDENYNAFMTEYLADGRAEGRAYVPHILSTDGALMMSRRHINNDWYIIMRPKMEFGDHWDMYWRVSSLDLRMEGGLLNTAFDLQTIEETRTLQLERMEGSSPVYERSGKGVDIAVYSALDGYIAVIQEKDFADAGLENVRLHIEGSHDEIEVSGYNEGGAAVYCCMLTDAELAALQKNARLEIRHIESVNERIYRTNEADKFSYFSRAEDELIFTINKEKGKDPVDDKFRVIFSGEPDCFVEQTPLEDRLYDFTGTRIETKVEGQNHLVAERITPLAWKGERGVLLAESSVSVDYAVGEKAIASGVELGEKYDLSGGAPRDKYICWLMDQDGRALTEARYHEVISVWPNGNILFHDLHEGEFFEQGCDFLVDAD